MPALFLSLSKKPNIRIFLVASLLAGTIVAPGPVRAQTAPNGGPDFDPVTRAFSDKNPPPGTAATAAQPQLTPEQQAALAEQQRQAKIQQMREDAKKKREAADKARKEKEEIARKAEEDHMAALKAKREERLEQMKSNRQQLKALLEEQKEARKAYEQSKQSATGSTSQIDDDYHKAEKDREDKIRELRHPKYKPIDDKKPSSGSSGMTGNNVTTAPH